MAAEKAQALREHKARLRDEARVIRAEERAEEKKRIAKRDAELKRITGEGKKRFEAAAGGEKPRKPRKPSGPKPPRKPRKRESYADRIARLMAQGFTRAEARGHARKKKGELGITFGRRLAAAVVKSKDAKERLYVRGELLAHFGITHFDAEREFYGKQVKVGRALGPTDWHERRQMYEKIAAHLEQLFGTEQNEAFSLLFSP